MVIVDELFHNSDVGFRRVLIKKRTVEDDD